MPRHAGREYRVKEDRDLPSQILAVAVVDEQANMLATAGLWQQVYVRLDYVVRKDLVGTNLVIGVSHEGHTLFNSFDTDLSPAEFERRRAGHYRALVPLPRGLLRPGTYSVSAGTGFTSKSRIDFHPDVVSFDVATHDMDVTHKSYSRSAEVMTQLKWGIEELKSNMHI